MSRRDAQFALPAPDAARRAFDRAARSFDSSCFIHDEARQRLFERLDLLGLTPSVAVDLGAATGRVSLALAQRYPATRVLAIDTSLGMLAAAGASGADRIAGDAAKLPLADASVDLMVANLILPWCRPEYVFSEAARVLTDGGLFAFSTMGPDSLQQVRRAWAKVDDQVHVHALFDMHDLGDVAGMAGLAEPIVDVARMEVTYRDLASLVRDLRGCGAINVAAGRRRGLTGPRRWAAFEAAWFSNALDGVVPVTVELVLGQAWGRGRPARRTFRLRT